MDEYIKREVAVKAFNNFDAGRADNPPFTLLTPEEFAEYLYELLAADVAPVVHGRWEWFDEETGTPSTGYEREWGWRCSHCKEELPDDYDDPDDRPAFRFCYNCGAKMDGGADNG